MNIAERIQNLRKKNGISQEEFADKIGVSRQAVSKWESEQSLPDIEKIIAMSNYFNVSTDYILKGIEITAEENNKKIDSVIFTIIATAVNFIGLILAIMMWYEQQNTIATTLGIIIMAVGCTFFAIGQIMGSKITIAKSRKYFYLINLWILLFIPLAVCFNLLDGFFGGYTSFIAPYPIRGNSLISYGLCWLIYFGICIIGDFVLIKKLK